MARINISTSGAELIWLTQLEVDPKWTLAQLTTEVERRIPKGRTQGPATIRVRQRINDVWTFATVGEDWAKKNLVATFCVTDSEGRDVWSQCTATSQASLDEIMESRVADNAHKCLSANL